MKPLTMTLQRESNATLDAPPKLERELPPMEMNFKTPTKSKSPIKGDPEEDEFGLPRLFAEASHLSSQSPKKKKRGRPVTHKWTPY